MSAKNCKNCFKAEQLLVVLDRHAALGQQDLEGSQYILEILDGHHVPELGQTVQDRMQQLDADLASGQVVGGEALQDPEVDCEEEIGDVGREPQSRLGRFFALGFEQLLVQLGPLLGSLLFSLALK